MCVDSDSNSVTGCAYSLVRQPEGSVAHNSGCSESGVVLSGRICTFTKPGYFCPPVLCSQNGEWNTTMPQCFIIPEELEHSVCRSTINPWHRIQTGCLLERALRYCEVASSVSILCNQTQSGASGDSMCDVAKRSEQLVEGRPLLNSCGHF